METYMKVMHGIEKVSFHPKCKGVVESLIKALLRPKPCERLPMRAGGAANVQEHQWFVDTTFDWKAMEEGSFEPPFKPVVKSKTDMKNFHARKEDRPPQIPY